MPKAAVDKDDDALFWKDKIGLSVQPLIAPPSLNSMRAKN